MPSPFDALVDIIHAPAADGWKDRNEKALAALFGTRYGQRAEKSVALRAPDIQTGNEKQAPFAAYISRDTTTSGGYGGMSFVLFPADEADKPCLLGMVTGTQGLAPDEAILGRPGHARKLQAVCAWLRSQYGPQAAWAKQDPTRTDTAIPSLYKDAWSGYGPAFKKYGGEMYAMYRPTGDRAATHSAVTAMLDILFEERGQEVLTAYKTDAQKIRSRWFAHLMPTTDRATVVSLLARRRYVLLQGPPGTGKTTMADELREEEYAGHGQTIQFHPNTTYENFVGGLAPVVAAAETPSRQQTNDLGFRFAPKRGFLLDAAAAALEDPTRKFLLHIDEINRADLGKILGEAIYLFEPDAVRPRKLRLAYDFGTPFDRTLSLPPNLHILGTMNSADRSIAILDVAVRRRFAFLSLWPSLQVVQEHGNPVSLDAFQRLVALFVEHATEEALPLVPGHSYFLGKDEAQAPELLKASLAPLLTEYLAQGYVSGFAEPVRAYLQWLESLQPEP